MPERLSWLAAAALGAAVLATAVLPALAGWLQYAPENF